MDVTEQRDGVLRSERETPGTARMVPGGNLGVGLQTVDRRPHGGERRQHVGLRIERIDAALAPGPVTADSEAGPHAGSHQRLVFRLVAGILRAEFEQGDVTHAAGGVTPRRIDQVRQDRGAHAIEIGRDRVGEHHVIRAAAEQFRLLARHEGPGNAFMHAAAGEQPACGRRPALLQGQHRQRDRLVARQGYRRDRIQALDAQHLLDEVRLAVDVPAPGRRRDADRLTRHANDEAELVEDIEAFRLRHVEAAKTGDAVGSEAVAPLPFRRGAGDHQFRRLAAAEFHDQLRGYLRPVDQEFRVHAALEPVAGVGIDAQRAAGHGGADRIEGGHFEIDVDRLLGAAAFLAAHDAADTDGDAVVCNHADALGQGVFLAVERQQRLTGFR